MTFRLMVGQTVLPDWVFCEAYFSSVWQLHWLRHWTGSDPDWASLTLSVRSGGRWQTDEKDSGSEIVHMNLWTCWTNYKSIHYRPLTFMDAWTLFNFQPQSAAYLLYITYRSLHLSEDYHKYSCFSACRVTVCASAVFVTLLWVQAVLCDLMWASHIQHNKCKFWKRDIHWRAGEKRQMLISPPHRLCKHAITVWSRQLREELIQ